MEKLKAFRHLFGKVSDEKIAAMAGVTLEEVQAARAEAEKPEADAGTGAPDTGTGDTGDSSGGDSSGDSGGDTTDVNITGSTGSDPERAALVGKVAELERALEVKKIELERAREQIGMLEERLLVAAEKRPTEKPSTEKPQPEPEKPQPGQSKPSTEKPSTAPKPEPENPAPSSVRVVRNAEIPRGPDGRRWTLGFRDVYSGEQARWLWEKHPALVEPYPPAK